MIERVVATDAARALIAQLRARHGKVMFYQSHGCCEGSMPMCFAEHEMQLNSGDVQLGTIDDVPFWCSAVQRDYLSGLQLTLDVDPGNGGTFSLEDGSGQHFVVRLRLWTDEESRALEAQAAEAAVGTGGANG
ncbi:DUF779 domain-containing protein [Ideonella sp. A 288]|uniref:DUF779 domain-containing protein n=1 Tax=Ideonella sp. A 288 TaxID=1962181 RepID=UPI0018FEC1D8|nr:DUF779 domain-containing protein [Ideonella sp. A 288]